MQENQPIIVLDPSEGPVSVEAEMAKRLGTLEGKVLGVVNNGKRNSNVFLSALVEELKREYGLKDILWIDKSNASLPITPNMLEQLKSAHAVVAGVGD